MADQNDSIFTTFARKKLEYVEEELGQRGQSEFWARLLFHEETRLTIVCLALLAVILSLLFFFTTRTMFLLFMTLVLTFVLYGWLEAHCSKPKRPSP
jgi:lipopolysaccharide export LptBFGC system permease protein LptF